MRVVVVGAGRMGALRTEDLAADPRVTQVLLTNRSPVRAVALAARFGAEVLAWERLGEEGADAYVVALATGLHAQVLHTVLARGRPVLCEKPVALTLADTQRAIHLAAETGSELQIGFQRRFDAGLRAARDRIADGRLGTLYSMRLISHDHQPSDAAFIASSGGIFRDLHVHDLDLIAWLTGSPVATVYATTAVREHRRYGELGDGDVSLIHAVTSSGVQASVHGARHDPRGHDVRVEVFGSQDSVTAGLTERTPLLALDGSLVAPAGGSAPVEPYTGFIDRFRDAFRAETTSFVDLVAGGVNRCPPQAALESLRAAIACEVSLARSAPVTVDEITTEAH